MNICSCTGSVVPIVASVFALAYAAYVLNGFWNKKFVESLSTGELSKLGKIHVLVWTIGPPVWFFLEYWVASHYCCPNDKDALANVKLWEDLAKTFWAGILAAALFLKGK